MRKTYAYNSIIFGALLGMLVYVSADSIALGIVTCVAVSVVGFIIIRLIENAINKGVDKAVDSVSNAYRKHKAKKVSANGAAAQRTPAVSTTQFPTREQPRRFADENYRLKRNDSPQAVSAQRTPAVSTTQFPTREQPRHFAATGYRPQMNGSAAAVAVPRASAYGAPSFPTREQTRRIINDIRPNAVSFRYCPYCNSGVEHDARFCTVCGGRLQ